MKAKDSRLILPRDMRAEVIFNYLKDRTVDVEVKGPHKRLAYGDMADVTLAETGYRMEIVRKGLYDILPEALFHPVDRFENIPSNEYKERFEEECEAQREEESRARGFFAPFDRFIFELGCMVQEMKDLQLADLTFLTGILCDDMPGEMRSNRLVARMLPFMHICRLIRGDVPMLILILRKVLRDEGVLVRAEDSAVVYRDLSPTYRDSIEAAPGIASDEEGGMYLGNEYDEHTRSYYVRFWDEGRCDGDFLRFVEEIKVFERFVNDYFMGIGTAMHIIASVEESSGVRLSDDLKYSYLDYNTNI